MSKEQRNVKKDTAAAGLDVGHMAVKDSAEDRFIHTHCWGNQPLLGTQVYVPIAEVKDTAVCVFCQRPLHPVPFAFRETVQFRRHFGQEYLDRGKKYALVLGTHWYGQWVIDVQHVRPHVDDPEFLELTPVKEYMVPAFAVERSPLQWSAPHRGIQAKKASISMEQALHYLRQHLEKSVPHTLFFLYSNAHFNVYERVLAGCAYATYPGEEGFMVVASLFQQDDLTTYVPLSAIVEIHIEQNGSMDSQAWISPQYFTQETKLSLPSTSKEDGESHEQ